MVDTRVADVSFSLYKGGEATKSVLSGKFFSSKL